MKTMLSHVTKSTFITFFKAVQYEVHQNSKEKGFAVPNRNIGEQLALIHSEISEALEASRNNYPPDHHCPEFSNFEIELADAIIRIMDLAEDRGLRIPEAIIAKHIYNLTREYKHGKTF